MKSVMTTLATGLVAAGLIFAQTTQPAPAAGTHQHERGARIARLVQVLNLTPDQQTQAKAIFQASRTSAQPLASQMRDTRLALANAVKTNAPEAEIDQLSAKAGAIAGQLTAVRTKTFEKFYNILTPDQKDKLNGMMDHFLTAHRGRGFQRS